MNWYTIAGAASIITLFTPVFLILFFKLYKNKSLLVLLVYYSASGIYNLMAQGFITIPVSARKAFGTVLNYLDAPMMLAVLLFFCAAQWKRRVIYFSMALFCIYEVFILFSFHLSPISNSYILGPGILIILLYSSYLLFQHSEATVVHGKGLGLTMVLVSILFSYGCFSIIYFMHYLQKTSALADVLLIYYIVLIISSVSLSIGLIWIQKRIKDIEEVQLTRKELAHFFDT
jgi:hypothetical protein